MKFRTILLFAIALTGIYTMTSCVKNYTCHCNIKYSGEPGMPDSTTEEYTIANTKSNAQSECQKNSTTYNNNYITTVDSCYLY